MKKKRNRLIDLRGTVGTVEIITAVGSVTVGAACLSGDTKPLYIQYINIINKGEDRTLVHINGKSIQT